LFEKFYDLALKGLFQQKLKNELSYHIALAKMMFYHKSLNEGYRVKSGVLSFSGSLSMNNLVEKDIPVMCNARLKNTIMKRVRVLAVGIKNSSLFALYYVPSVRGMALGLSNNNTVGISMSNFKEKDCASYNSFTIKDWFGDAKIVELER
jgi:hypothetical protein